MYDFMNNDMNISEEEMKERELEEAERMVRNGANSRQIAFKRFTFLEQSDIFKLYRKYGKDMHEDDECGW